MKNVFILYMAFSVLISGSMQNTFAQSAVWDDAKIKEVAVGGQATQGNKQNCLAIRIMLSDQKTMTAWLYINPTLQGYREFSAAVFAALVGDRKVRVYEADAAGRSAVLDICDHGGDSSAVGAIRALHLK